MDGVGDDTSAVASENGFATNGFASNGFAINGFATNGFTANGFRLQRLRYNGFTTNGFATNGIATNGFAMNGFAINGFATTACHHNGSSVQWLGHRRHREADGLSSTSGLMTTEGGRQFVNYMVKIGYPAGHSLTKQDQMSANTVHVRRQPWASRRRLRPAPATSTARRR